MSSSDCILTPHLIPTTQFSLPSSLKPQLYTSSKNTNTHYSELLLSGTIVVESMNWKFLYSK